MGDTFHAIIVGECLPATHKGDPVADMGYVRAFEDGFADTEAMLTKLGMRTRSALSRSGVWLVNMTKRPGGYVSDRDAAIAKWREDLAGPKNGGLFRATQRNIHVLCLSNYVAEDVAVAHGFSDPIPCVSGTPRSCSMPRGGHWQFATWYRTDMRAGTNAERAQAFLARI